MGNFLKEYDKNMKELLDDYKKLKERADKEDNKDPDAVYTSSINIIVPHTFQIA